MFARALRVRHDKDMQKILRSKKGAFDKAAGVKMVSNGLPYSRFSVVAGTKVDKRAVVRNHLKRQYRALLQEFQKNILPGFDVVLLLSKEAIPLTYDEKRKRLASTLKRANLFSATATSGAAHSAVSKNPIV